MRQAGAELQAVGVLRWKPDPRHLICCQLKQLQVKRINHFTFHSLWWLTYGSSFCVVRRLAVWRAVLVSRAER